MEQKAPDRKRIQAVYFHLYEGQQQFKVIYAIRYQDSAWVAGHVLCLMWVTWYVPL